MDAFHPYILDINPLFSFLHNGLRAQIQISGFNELYGYLLGNGNRYLCSLGYTFKKNAQDFTRILDRSYGIFNHFYQEYDE